MAIILSEEAKEARRTYLRGYLREWHARNPEKSEMYKAKYWEKKAKQLEAQKPLNAQGKD